MTMFNEAVKAAHRDETAITIALPHGVNVDLGTLDIAAIGRLAQYGARQWVQDAVAGLAKEMKAEGASDADIEAAKVAEMEARWAAILDGTVGTRSGGPRVRGVEKIMRDVAVERIRAGAAKLGKKLPKGEEYQSLVTAYVAKHSDALRAEAERRMAEGSEEDLSDLLG